MILAYYLKDKSLAGRSEVTGLLDGLQSAGFSTVPVDAPGPLPQGTDMLLSLGGDGTFLTAAAMAEEASVPVLGVNFGRLGFLSENRPEDVLDALVKGTYSISLRGMLQVSGWEGCTSPLKGLNDICVSRKGASMLGVDVSVDGRSLPTYWVDGLLVSTSSGSTAYSLSVGGPICHPASRVLIVAPVAPHNLNVRPLIVPDDSRIRISFRSRDDEVKLTVDNCEYLIPAGSVLEVDALPLSLQRVVLSGSNFIAALRGKLHWGEDLRNETVLR